MGIDREHGRLASLELTQELRRKKRVNNLASIYTSDNAAALNNIIVHNTEATTNYTTNL